VISPKEIVPPRYIREKPYFRECLFVTGSRLFSSSSRRHSFNLHIVLLNLARVTYVRPKVTINSCDVAISGQPKYLTEMRGTASIGSVALTDLWSDCFSIPNPVREILFHEPTASPVPFHSSRDHSPRRRYYLLLLVTGVIELVYISCSRSSFWTPRPV
jgi:hypothetical protein